MRNIINRTRRYSNRTQGQLIAWLALTVFLVHIGTMGAQLPVNLGTAGNYVILAKSGVRYRSAFRGDGQCWSEPYQLDRHNGVFTDTGWFG